VLEGVAVDAEERGRASAEGPEHEDRADHGSDSELERPP
jgi:hypothetical protein